VLQVCAKYKTKMGSR